MLKTHQPSGGRLLSLRCGRRAGWRGTVALATSWCLRPPVEDVHNAIKKELSDHIANYVADNEQRRIQAANARGSSSKGNKMRKKRKRRKKKTPKTHSSSSLICQSSSRGGIGIRGIMRDEFEDVGTVHAEPLNSVHDKEVAGYLDEMIKLIEENVWVNLSTRHTQWHAPWESR